MCSLFRPWLSHSPKQPASLSFPLSHSCSLFSLSLLSLSLTLACTFSNTQALSLSLSLDSTLTRRLVRGSRPPPPFPTQPVGGSLAALCKRGFLTRTSGLQRFHNLGERREEEWKRGGEKRECVCVCVCVGGGGQCEQSIPPAGYTRSYRLKKNTMSSHETNKRIFDLKPVKLD